jgi:hypothetical protein
VSITNGTADATKRLNLIKAERAVIEAARARYEHWQRGKPTHSAEAAGRWDDKHYALTNAEDCAVAAYESAAQPEKP